MKKPTKTELEIPEHAQPGDLKEMFASSIRRITKLDFKPAVGNRPTPTNEQMEAFITKALNEFQALAETLLEAWDEAHGVKPTD